MKELIKPVIRMDNVSETVQTAVKYARLEFTHRQELLRLAESLAYTDDRTEIRYVEHKMLRETSEMIFAMNIKEDAESKMSLTELNLYKSML